MSTAETFVIVGAGLAGGKAAEALREQGFDGRIFLVGSEAHRPYERPPLSKGYLTQSAERESVFVHPQGWYDEHNVELRLGQAVGRIKRSEHRVDVGEGTSLKYDKLLLATGASPRRLSVPGADAPGVHVLRNIDESEALQQTFERSSRLAIVGAGWIGLEVAAAARAAGVEVTVIEASDLPLLRVLGPEVAQVFADLHRQHSVDFRFGAAVEEIVTVDGRAAGVRLADGTVIGADAVLVAVGAGPNSQLAQAAGLAIDNGIQVDASLQTSDPDIFAAGDVANALHPFYGKHVRVEHWANALEQPVVAAASMLGQTATYDQLPYFYTDQFDLGMEYVGFAEPGGYDEVVLRGDVEKREFIAFWLKDRQVLAGMNVNVWDVVDPIKALIRSRQVIDPAQLADPQVNLTDLVPAS